MHFIGVDLSWSPKNKSGYAVLKEKNHKLIRVESGIFQELEEFVSIYKKYENSYVAIDAPLIVPNEKGSRKAEHYLNKEYSKFNAGAYHCNRKLLSKYNRNTIPRGEELIKKLDITCDPNLIGKRMNLAFEVYPHSSLVSLFNLKKIIQYKKKKGRKKQFLIDQMRIYAKHLNSLNIENCYFQISDTITEKKRKEIEDIWDGYTCAYIAYYAFKNKSQIKVFGDENGHIVTIHKV